MKTFKAMCAATLLALSLSIPAHADPPPPGDSHTPGRSIPAAGDVGTATPEPGDTLTTSLGSALYGDSSIATLADIVWTLASIY